MRKLPKREIPAHVEWIQDGKVTVRAGRGPSALTLVRLGGWSPLILLGPWRFRTKDDVELARLLGRLRDLGVAMLGQPAGWPPAAIFEDLRAKGLVEGAFDEITWRGPEDCVLFRNSADQPQ